MPSDVLLEFQACLALSLRSNIWLHGPSIQLARLTAAQIGKLPCCKFLASSQPATKDSDWEGNLHAFCLCTRAQQSPGLEQGSVVQVGKWQWRWQQMHAARCGGSIRLALMQACNWPQKRPIAPFIICRIVSLRLLSLASKRGCERIGFSLVSRVARPAHPLSFAH